MRVEFKTEQLRKVCESEKEMARKYGAEGAKKLRRRLAEIEAAPTLADLKRVPQARLHPLTKDRAGQWSVALDGGRRLCFDPRPVPVPTLKDGGVDLSGVTGAYLLEVVDYHD